MPSSTPTPRLRHAILLILTVSAVLLALPAASVARAHKSSCHSTATAHSKHAANKCPRPAHKPKRTHAKRHHPAHARPKHKTHAPSTSGTEEAEGATEAICADGSTPFASEEGSFSCEDGSAPHCEAGRVEVVSNDGSTLLCEVPASEEEQENH
jgi:hypothetical protein